MLRNVDILHILPVASIYATHNYWTGKAAHCSTIYVTIVTYEVALTKSLVVSRGHLAIHWNIYKQLLY